MRYIATILMVTLLIVPSVLYAGAWKGKVVSVLEGDTIKVLKEDKQVKIRLASIDCPEKEQPYWQTAKNFTANLVDRMIVNVWPTGTDRYGRIIAYVFVDGIDLNKELLKAGMAWHQNQNSRDPELARLEFQARSQKRGLWEEPNPVPPWEFRNKSRPRNNAKRMESILSSVGRAYHGDVSSKIFHKPACRDYDCKNCTTIFQNRNEAISAGYKACIICIP